MEIILRWHGPLRLGQFPEEHAALDDLYVPGVYLRVRQYPRRTVSYVGQSQYVIWRVAEHLTNTLGLNYALRDETGSLNYKPDFYQRFERFNDIDETMERAIAEAKRMEFFIALCDDDCGFDREHLNLVEAALKARIENLLIPASECENIQGVPKASFDGYVRIKSCVGALTRSDRDRIHSIIGDKPIDLSAEAVGLGHAE